MGVLLAWAWAVFFFFFASSALNSFGQGLAASTLWILVALKVTWRHRPMSSSSHQLEAGADPEIANLDRAPAGGASR